MKELLISLLESFGYPVFLQGSLEPDEPYPDSFFTFWNNDSYDEHFYDNVEHSMIWDFDVYFYSTDPALVDSLLLDVKRLLKSHKFIVNGAGHDVQSDEETHTGREIRVLYLQHKEE